MVIIDEEAASPLKQGLHVPEALSDGTQSVAGTSAPPTYDSLRPVAVTPLVRPKRAERAGKRFFKALFVSLVIYVLLLAIARGIWELVDHHHERHEPPSRPAPIPPRDPDRPSNPPGSPQQPLPGPPGVPDPPPRGSPPTPGKDAGIWCHDFSSESVTSERSITFLARLKEILAAILRTTGVWFRPRFNTHVPFEFPEDLPLFFVKSENGGHFGGIVTLEPSRSASDEIVVDVNVLYDSRDVRDRTKICRVRTDDGAEGLTIELPEDEHSGESSDRLAFDITVFLPRAAPRTVKPLQSVQITLDNFEYKVSDLRNLFKFGKVDFEGKNGGMHVESIDAKEAIFRTVNGPIIGSFFVDTVLDVSSLNGQLEMKEASAPKGTFTTTNGAIVGNFIFEDVIIAATSGKVDVSVELTKMAGSLSKATLSTTHGLLRSEFTLSNVGDLGANEKHGIFDIDMSTYSGGLSVSFLDQPVSSSLKLEGRSLYGTSNVILHPAFEGTIRLQNKMERPLVTQGEWADPSGRSRLRQVEINPFDAPLKKVLSGTVKWLDDDDTFRHGNGTIDMSLAFGKNRLTL